MGETSSSFHERMVDDWGAKNKKIEDAQMCRHHQKEHGCGEEQKFIANVVQ